MQEKPPMNFRQMGIVSFIHGMTAFLTCFVFLITVLGPLAQSNRRFLLGSAGIVGILVTLGAFYLCAKYFHARGNEYMVSNQQGQQGRRWRRIFRRALEGSLGAFIGSAGLLLLIHFLLSSALLAGLAIAMTWGIAIILVYVVWPEGLAIDKWLRWW